MGLFYKISKAQADALGRFFYGTCQAFDPYVSEQIDGTYIVSEDMVNRLKDTPEFQKVNWTTLTKADSTQLATKVDLDAGTKTGGTGSK